MTKLAKTSPAGALNPSPITKNSLMEMTGASFCFRSNLSFKLGLALGFLCLIGLLNAFVLSRIAADLSGIAETINIAGRLRMLRQKAIIDTLATDPAKGKGITQVLARSREGAHSKPQEGFA